MGKNLRDLARLEIRERGAKLPPGPGLLLLVVADKVRDDPGILWAGERTVCGWVGRSASTYRDWRRTLEDEGLIKREGAYYRGKAARWIVLPQRLSADGSGFEADAPTARRGRAVLDERAQDRLAKAKDGKRTKAPRKLHEGLRNRTSTENLNPSSTEEKVLREVAL